MSSRACSGRVAFRSWRGEHRLNTHRAKINANRMFLGDHERRLREAERLNAALAAELVAEREAREALQTDVDALKATAAE